MFFRHKYIHGYRRRTAKAQDGQIKEILTITARIQLDPQKPGYDPDKDGTLQTDVVEFAKSTGDVFDSIEFEQGVIDA